VSEEDDKLDLSEWPTMDPPAGFAERVLERVQPARKPARRLRRRWLGLGAAAVAVAASLALGVGRPPSRGEAIAKERMELAMGTRAKVVLEPGAKLAWDGDEVVQDRGDVFYRVEPGARFRVHTPAGDVEVKGTCFTVKVRSDEMQKRDVKAGAVGAALSALAFVAVYEGKVAVSHAKERVELAAGETAQTGEGGVKKTGDLAAGQKALEEQTPEEQLASANTNLVDQVRDYRQRLEAIEKQKASLEQRLHTTEQKLEAAQSDGAAPRKRHDFDLSTDDWKELAKDGTVKYMYPCSRRRSWKPSPEQLNDLGLAPNDASLIESAFKRSNERQWAAIRPLCIEALGSAEAADKVGLDSCIHVVLEQAQGKNMAEANEAMRQVGEIRAGLRPMPPANQQNAVMKLFLATTGELQQFESDLAQGLGPEDAHRVVYTPKALCLGQSTFGGPGPREPEKK
jgi:hypothetical protein